MANAPYALGVQPYLPLLSLVTDRHVDAFTLAGTKDEVTAHILELRRAGIDSIIVRPLGADDLPVQATIAALGEIWPAVKSALA